MLTPPHIARKRKFTEQEHGKPIGFKISDWDFSKDFWISAKISRDFTRRVLDFWECRTPRKATKCRNVAFDLWPESTHCTCSFSKIMWLIYVYYAYAYVRVRVYTVYKQGEHCSSSPAHDTRLRFKDGGLIFFCRSLLSDSISALSTRSQETFGSFPRQSDSLVHTQAILCSVWGLTTLSLH